jgi:cytoskeletal protein CcmA (bactofilin family)
MKHTMRKSLLALALGLVVGVPLIVGARGAWNDARFVLGHDETKTGNIYSITESTLIAGTVKGDAVMGGKSVTVTGLVESDVLAAGAHVQLTGAVAGDVRVAASELLLSGKVGGDLVLLSGRSYIAEGTQIGGNVLAAGGDMTIDGAVAGTVHISGGTIVINGPVSGSVDINGAKLTLGEKAVLSGDLHFRGPQAPIIAPGALVHGKTQYTKDDFGSSDFGRFAGGVSLGAALIMLLISVLIALVLFLVFKKHANTLLQSSLVDPWKNIGNGLIGLILTVVISGGLIVSIFGFPIGIFGLLLLAQLGILASALSGVVFGVWVVRVLFKKADHQPTVTTIVWGTIVLRLITAVPVIGWIIGALFFLMSLGVLLHEAYVRFWVNR